jgi:hypothetical protein
MDPFDERTTDRAFAIHDRYSRQRVRGPYRHEGNAWRALQLLPNQSAWDLVVLQECRIRCYDEQLDTPESEWEK